MYSWKIKKTFSKILFKMLVFYFLGYKTPFCLSDCLLFKDKYIVFETGIWNKYLFMNFYLVLSHYSSLFRCSGCACYAENAKRSTRGTENGCKKQIQFQFLLLSKNLNWNGAELRVSKKKLTLRKQSFPIPHFAKSFRPSWTSLYQLLPSSGARIDDNKQLLSGQWYGTFSFIGFTWYIFRLFFF